MPTSVLLRGLEGLLQRLYAPEVFFARALRSLEAWCPDAKQKPPTTPLLYDLGVWLKSMWKQGVRSTYRRAYWKFTWSLIRKYRNDPAKTWLGISVLLSAHHFVIYAEQVAAELEQECRSVEMASAARSEAPLVAEAAVTSQA